MPSFAEAVAVILSGPSETRKLYDSQENQIELSLVIRRKDGEEEVAVVAILDGISISSSRVLLDGKIRREFEGRYSVKGVILVNGKWRCFEGQYCVDTACKGEIFIGSEVRIINRPKTPR